MGKSAVNSNDISVTNAKHRDIVLSIGARYLASTKNTLWYCETLILSARFIQLLKLSQWGSNSKLLANRYKLWSKVLIPKVDAGAMVYEFGVALVQQQNGGLKVIYPYLLGMDLTLLLDFQHHGAAAALM